MYTLCTLYRIPLPTCVFVCMLNVHRFSTLITTSTFFQHLPVILHHSTSTSSSLPPITYILPRHLVTTPLIPHHLHITPPPRPLWSPLLLIPNRHPLLHHHPLLLIPYSHPSSSSSHQRKNHRAVMAKYSCWPFWPAKVEYITNDSMYCVRFFGKHHETFVLIA